MNLTLAWYRILQNNESQSLANLLCVRLEKNSFAGWPKEKLLGAQDQGTAQGWLRRWPERLLNITTNYITTSLEALHQKIINQKRARHSPALLVNIIENYISRIRVRAMICFNIRSLPLSN